MNNKIKHHYVSKFVLKNFSRNNQIFQYRFDSKKSICVSINDAFTKSNLNTLEDVEGVKHHNLIEDIYDKYIESSAAISIKKIIEDLKKIPPSGKEFTIDDHVHLLRFAILSNFRTPYVLEEAHHFLKVTTYGTVFLKYFLDFGNLDFPYELDVNKGLLFSFLDDFDKATLLLTDLKLTLYYHRLPNTFFIIPDQYVLIESPNDTKFGDPQLKIYFPISSNVVVCFERIDREYSKAAGELTKEQVEAFNIFFASNSYDAIGCEDKEYLDNFIKKHGSEIKPLTKYDSLASFEAEKIQIKAEIIYKLCISPHQEDYYKSIITYIDRNHNFHILTKDEFDEKKYSCKNIFGIKLKQYRI